MQVKGDRLWADLMTLAQIGAGVAGGNNRMSLTDADRDGRALFAHWCREAGLAVTVDAMGNTFGRLEGRDAALPPVLAGSHLDTQESGGRFDGPLGVLAALEAARAIREAGITPRRAIEVVNWTNEEGCRFSPGLMGSAVFAGTLPLAEAHAVTDRAGRSVGAELARIGWKGAAPVGGRPVDAYFELHIEQGPLLEQAGVTIGAVTQSCHSAFTDAICHGETSHIQSTPMPQRRNALFGAARLIEAIERTGYAHAPEGTASTVMIDAWPNNRIVLPSRVGFSYGVIHPEEAGLAAMVAAIDAAAEAIAAETGLRFEIALRRIRRPFHFAEELVALTEQVAGALGHSAMRMRTRPGHDAFNMVALCPTALIFVPCRNGLSHNETEWCEPAHCTAGAAVLAEAVLRRADRPAGA